MGKRDTQKICQGWWVSLSSNSKQRPLKEASPGITRDALFSKKRALDFKCSYFRAQLEFAHHIWPAVRYRQQIKTSEYERLTRSEPRVIAFFRFSRKLFASWSFNKIHFYNRIFCRFFLLQQGQSHRTIQKTAVHVRVTEMLSKATGQRSFAASRWSVDRNNNAVNVISCHLQRKILHRDRS